MLTSQSHFYIAYIIYLEPSYFIKTQGRVLLWPVGPTDPSQSGPPSLAWVKHSETDMDFAVYHLEKNILIWNFTGIW